MDLLRLALERAADPRRGRRRSSSSLLERHGQGGSCSHEHPRFTYDNSFLVADPDGRRRPGDRRPALGHRGGHRPRPQHLQRADHRRLRRAVRRPGCAAASPSCAVRRGTDHRQRGDRRRGGRHDRRAARPRRPGPALVPGQRRARRALRPRRRPGHLDPEHGLVGRRPAGHPAALGDGHLGAVHRPVPPDHGGPARWPEDVPGEPVRRGLGVVAPRAAAPGRAAGPAGGAGALS